MKHLEFKDKYKELLLSGRKKATIRLQCYVREGDEVFVHCGGKIIGTAKIKKVEERSLEDVDEELAKADGFNSKEELINEIKKLYGCPKKVYVIWFDFKPFKNGIDPHEMYYSNVDLVEIAKKALESLSLSEGDRRILELFIKTQSIRKTAIKLGGIKKRGIVRKVLRKCLNELRKRGLI
ncbi:ASCH domain-containing protein [Archaeoglobus sp.]